MSINNTAADLAPIRIRLMTSNDLMTQLSVSVSIVNLAQEIPITIV